VTTSIDVAGQDEKLMSMILTSDPLRQFDLETETDLKKKHEEWVDQRRILHQHWTQWNEEWIEKYKAIHALCQALDHWNGEWIDKQEAIHALCQALDGKCMCALCQLMTRQAEKESHLRIQLLNEVREHRKDNLKKVEMRT
jgi:hypothetical protein